MRHSDEQAMALGQEMDAVEAWGEPLVPQAHADRVQALLAEARSAGTHPGPDWSLVKDSGGFKCYAPRASKDVKELSCFAEGTLHCSTKVAFELLGDEGLIKTLDDNVETVTVLERDHHNRFSHVLMKGMYFTAPRDVCTLEHWRVEPGTGTIYKCGFSVDHKDAPEHPDPSVRVRALSRGWTVITPDPSDARKCHIKMQVDIDVRLEHIPQWVQRTLAGSAQKVNAQTFCANIKQVNDMCRKKQRKCAASHVVVNAGGAVREVGAAEVVEEEPEPEFFTDLKAVDVALALLVVLSYSAAVLTIPSSPEHY